jgi:lysine-specific demethylase 8
MLRCLSVSLQVARIHRPSEVTFVRDFVNTGTPVIIEGVVSSWQAVARWGNLDYLIGLVGRRKLVAKVSRDRTFADDVEYKEVRFDEFVETLSDASPERGRYYLADVQISRLLPELLEDLGEPPYFAPFTAEWRGHFRGLFLGRDARTPLHYHMNNMALTAQLVGRKFVRLYPPSQCANMYNSRFSTLSPVDPSRADLKRYPKFAKATALECTLSAGDLLFIPVHWWHYVQSPGISAAVLFAYNAPLRTWHFPTPGLESLAFTLYSMSRRALWDKGKYRTLTSPARSTGARRD